jgi:hypothetical protein
MTTESGRYVILRASDVEGLMEERRDLDHDAFWRPVPYETRHVLDLGYSGWGLEHPIDCRLEGRSLHDCPGHVVVSAQMQDGPPHEEGRFAVTVEVDEFGESFALLGETVASAVEADR